MSGWTDERVDLLNRLWRAGASASLIAEQIGVTRNAVIGKAHRLGLPEHPWRQEEHRTEIAAHRAASKAAERQLARDARRLRAEARRAEYLADKARRREVYLARWREILEDARQRGISNAELAEEMGLTRAAISKQCSALGVVLARKRRQGRPRARAPEYLAEEFQAAMASGEHVNAFCFRIGISHSTLVKIEREYGMKLPRRVPRPAMEPAC